MPNVHNGETRFSVGTPVTNARKIRRIRRRRDAPPARRAVQNVEGDERGVLQQKREPVGPDCGRRRPKRPIAESRCDPAKLELESVPAHETVGQSRIGLPKEARCCAWMKISPLCRQTSTRHAAHHARPPERG